MSHDEQDSRRSLFWLRLRENARTIVEQQHADLQKQTCAPKYCLLEEDKEKMRHRQYLLDQYNRDITRLGHDGCRSRALALTTVLWLKPSLLFK